MRETFHPRALSPAIRDPKCYSDELERLTDNSSPPPSHSIRQKPQSPQPGKVAAVPRHERFVSVKRGGPDDHVRRVDRLAAGHELPVKTPRVGRNLPGEVVGRHP